MSKTTINYGEKDLLSRDINMIDCDPGFPAEIMGKGALSKEDMIKGASDYMDFMCSGTEVTDMCFAVFAQTSFVECKSMGLIYSNKTDEEMDAWINREDEDGEPFTHAKRKAFKGYPAFGRALKEYDVDWPLIATEECRKRGVNPWLYFRMNDLHAVNQIDSLFHDPFYFKAKENGWLNGNPKYGRPMGTSGRIENVYDFAHAEVREWMLTYIEEIMMRYDVYGYGLDFMRNIYCFDYLRAEAGYQEYMNDFMRRVRDIANRAGEKHGHPIKLMACLGHTVKNNFIYGFDVKTWAKEGLVDMIAARCEEVCNSGVDIKEWKEALGDKVAFLIGFDDHITRWADAGAEYIYQLKIEHLKGLCASYFSRGVNGFYYNNFYAPSQVKFAKEVGRESSGVGLRTFVVTHEDIAPIGGDRYAPLPLELGGKVNFGMNIGTVKSDEHFYVTVGYDCTDASGVKVAVDGNYATKAELTPVIYDRVAGHYYDDDRNLLKAAALMRYEFDGLYPDGDFTVTFEGGEGINIVYLECSVSPEEIL